MSYLLQIEVDADNLKEAHRKAQAAYEVITGRASGPLGWARDADRSRFNHQRAVRLRITKVPTLGQSSKWKPPENSGTLPNPDIDRGAAKD